MSDDQQSFLMGHIHELHKKVQDLQTSFNTVLSKVSIVDRIDSLTQDIEALKASRDKSVSVASDLQKSINISHNSLSQKLEEIALNLADASSNISLVKGQQEKGFQDHGIRQKSIEDAQNISISNLRQDLKSSLKDFEDKHLASPSSILESNQTVVNKLEACRMDYSNIGIKFTNFDSQMILLQRKLENLEIRTKKIELEKQA